MADFSGSDSSAEGPGADFSGLDSSAEGPDAGFDRIEPTDLAVVPVDPKAVLWAVAKMIELPDDPRA